MEKFMKIWFVVLIVFLAVCSIVLTISSIIRHEWMALIWLMLSVGSVYGVKQAIKEYKLTE